MAINSFSLSRGILFNTSRNALTGNTHDLRRPAGDGVDDHGPMGQQIDVASKLTRAMRDDVPIVIRGVEYLDSAGFDDEQIQIRIAGAKTACPSA